MKVADFRRRRAHTQLLRVPQVDWRPLTSGEKTELRLVGHYSVHHNRLHAPQPIVVWCFRRFSKEPQSKLMVLDAAWSEPLGAISPESLAREGFESLAEFRRYWRNRHHGVLASYKPLSTVQVYRLRPLEEADEADMGRALLRHLYADWLSAEDSDAP